MTPSTTNVLSTYRSLLRLIATIPNKSQKDEFQSQIQSSFRVNKLETDPVKIQALLQMAGEKIAYLRIITPIDIKRRRGRYEEDPASKTSLSSSKRFIYTKEGVEEISSLGNSLAGTPNRSTGRVVSNWDGKNLDPCAVKRHFKTLDRAGFKNNLHAKGLF